MVPKSSIQLLKGFKSRFVVLMYVDTFKLLECKLYLRQKLFNFLSAQNVLC